MHARIRHLRTSTVHKRSNPNKPHNITPVIQTPHLILAATHPHTKTSPLHENPPATSLIFPVACTRRASRPVKDFSPQPKLILRMHWVGGAGDTSHVRASGVPAWLAALDETPPARRQVPRHDRDLRDGIQRSDSGEARFLRGDCGRAVSRAPARCEVE